jgi:hypothetical protein
MIVAKRLFSVENNDCLLCIIKKCIKMKYPTLVILLIGLLTMSFVNAQDKLAKLRTEKKIITVDAPSAPYYAIQLLALQMPPQDPDFFNQITTAREFVCNDGYVRYVVGQYQTFADAAHDLEKYRAMGYADAFVANTKRLGAVASGFAPSRMNIVPDKMYTIQVSAFRFPVYLSHFENLDGVMEFYMKDQVYRYCIGKHLGAVIEDELLKIKNSGYKDAYIVELEAYLHHFK